MQYLQKGKYTEQKTDLQNVQYGVEFLARYIRICQIKTCYPDMCPQSLLICTSMGMMAPNYSLTKL